ncbi:alpha/beta hydrolase family esterase [Sulfitobacter sp. JB4-11]|uniref:alpha/beta hydrolase family esterase n=1 Tax=Sulfitobacter rhodophyticola TaxID=3238304 RepID=UPI003512163B
MKYILLFAVLLLPTLSFAQNCEGQTACRLGNRSYHVKLPDNWDGTTPLPVLLHFHGWQRTGALPVQHQRISGHTRRRGVLLIAPNGINKTWDFWQGRSVDVDFAAAVIEDAATRYPIDRSRIYISGYSYGSAMAWRYACENGDNIAALLAISGTLRQTENCPQQPGEVRHVHGLADNVLDFPFGADRDTGNAVALWRALFRCADSTETTEWNARDFLTFSRTSWTECADGTAVILDTHPGGHFIPHGWIGWQLDQLMGRTPQYP